MKRPKPAVRPSSLDLSALALCLALTASCSCSCGGEGGGESAAAPAAPSTGLPSASDLEGMYNLDIPTATYRWDPAAGDPSVSAEMGGPGFTGEGWETNMTFPALGQAGVPQGGSMTVSIEDWPATLRMAGKDWNTYVTYQIRDLCYESLLTMHPTTLEFIPNTATHWWISEDRMTYRFRINPQARFADGSEVTAEDFVASYQLRMDPTLLDPSSIMTFEKMEEPVALSKYILEVRCKESNWRNFIYIAGSALAVFPKQAIDMKGSEYLDTYQFSLVPGSGPYLLAEEDIAMGKSITLRRNENWWGQDNSAWDGLYNIGTYKFIVIKDDILEFEKFKKGEFDYFVIGRAQWWAEELPKVDAVQRGLIVRCKIFNDAPKGTSGMAINTQRPPLDDLRVRKALAHLYDRELLISKFMFHEYIPLQSHWPGGKYEHPDNESIEYDELTAVDLLEEAGWGEINEEGYRTKDGAALAFDLTYSSKGFEKYLTIFQEACRRAGIKIELQLQTPASRWKSMRQKEYDLTNTAWGAITIPNPETSWKGSLAGLVNNNNVTSFSNERVDELCRAYDEEYDSAKRAAIVQEIDHIVFNEHPYVLAWYKPAERVCYWNKFGMPEWGANRTWDYKYMHYSWWVDPEKERQLEAAREDSSLTLETPPVENHFWTAYRYAEQARPK